MFPKDYRPGATLSVFDKLTDYAPDSKKEARLSPWEEARELKVSLCHDLTDLLNTRRTEQDFDPNYEQATDSVLTFGIADFTSYNLKSALEQEQVRRSMERAIRQFEPRLTRVTVSMDPPDALKPVLRFQISAFLRVDPTAEPVQFDVSLHRDSRRIGVTGANS